MFSKTLFPLTRPTKYHSFEFLAPSQRLLKNGRPGNKPYLHARKKCYKILEKETQIKEFDSGMSQESLKKKERKTLNCSQKKYTDNIIMIDKTD